jgi:hypothetical protein
MVFMSARQAESTFGGVAMRLVSLILVFLVVGCSSKPVNMSKVAEGSWRARALIKDKEHSKTFIVVLDFNAVKGEQTRLDIASTLGQQVASLVTTNSEVKYFNADTKKFYTGTPRAEVLRPILSIPLDPRWLQNVLFDEPITAKNWTCKNDKDGMVEECREAQSGIVIGWHNRKGTTRTVDISHPKADIQMNFITFSNKISDKDKVFALEVPKGFQKLRLR